MGERGAGDLGEGDSDMGERGAGDLGGDVSDMRDRVLVTWVPVGHAGVLVLAAGSMR